MQIDHCKIDQRLRNELFETEGTNQPAQFLAAQKAKEVAMDLKECRSIVANYVKAGFDTPTWSTGERPPGRSAS